MKLEDLKPGDKVCYMSNWGKHIETVERVTKTLIITERGRYKRNSGHKTPSTDRWSWQQIGILTPEIKAELRRTNLLYALKNEDYGKFDSEVLEQIYTIIKKAKPLDQKAKGV